ncbi:hypothetical protein [Cytobacillus purgationiresistens]|uniref:Glutathione peroxidase homolog BsaA n=1 Tax=Cytobacillus purgationiresistens TaxID=863449 RepID=A0ABU0ALF4_9BACI|nr:hypothetical protein [Cytobacillus purgationiresistens]MDQ0272098.1 glutathione peroxidase-family protein [Cytobacillus purgationiresistens]
MVWIFPIYKKIDVRGNEAHPLFTYIESQKPFEGFNMNHPVTKLLMAILNEKYPHYLHGDSIKRNFTKFFIDKEGNVIERFESTTEPFEMESYIEHLL